MKLTLGIIIGTVVIFGVIMMLAGGRGSDYNYNSTTEQYEKSNSSNCTQDCSGHNAGYNWAADKGHTSKSDCTGNSDSFIEGCLDYVINN